MEGSSSHAHGHEPAHHAQPHAHPAHDAAAHATHPKEAREGARKMREQRPAGQAQAPLSREERRTVAILALALVAALAAVPVLSAMTLSPTGNVLLGLSPLLLTILLCLVAVSSHYKPFVLWIVLALTHLVGVGALTFANLSLPSKINVPQAVSVSLLLSAIVVFVAWVSEGNQGRRAPAGSVKAQMPAAEFSVESLPQFVRSLEDKAKALNFSIGRVYRSSNGGSAAMRERLRIPREWYNEFESASEHERAQRAKAVVRKIYDRLLQYVHREKDVFSEHELAGLSNIVRSPHGDSTVLEVLAANDSDPVQTYYVAAVEFCEQVLTGLERQRGEWRGEPASDREPQERHDRPPRPGDDDEDSIYDLPSMQTANSGG